MRHYRLILFIFALVGSFQAGCQEQSKIPKGSPKIAFEKSLHDFGEASAKKKYTAEFKFSNTGDAVLRITEVKRCCSVTAKLNKEEFAPGESGVLTVNYLSGPNSSLMARQLQVISNDPVNPIVKLTIKARVVPKVAYEPERLKLELKKENAGCSDITLTALDDQAFAIKSFKSTGGSITAEVDSSVEATEFVIQPKVDLERLQKSSSGFINIHLTHPECPAVLLAFSTQLRFTIKPRSLNLLNPEPQKPRVKTVTVVNNYGEDFEVQSTSSEKGFLKVLSKEETKKGYQFEVEITPPPNDGTDRFTDVLYLHLDDEEKLPIKCYGRYADLKE